MSRLSRVHVPGKESKGSEDDGGQDEFPAQEVAPKPRDKASKSSEASKPCQAMARAKGEVAGAPLPPSDISRAQLPGTVLLAGTISSSVSWC